MPANKKFYITAAALASLTAASSSSSNSTSVPSSCTVTATATAQSDLDNLGSCSTVVGTLNIGEDLVNPTLSNVQTIIGSLNVANSANIVSFAAADLEIITENLELFNLTSLETATFPKLANVSGISLDALPVVDNVVLNALETASNVVISDTSLESLSGFENLENVEVFNINNNNNLVSLKSPLKTISNALEITANGQGMAVAFDNLTWVNNVTIIGAESVSFASLETVNASLGFLNNTMAGISIPTVSEVGSSLSIVSNDKLTSLDFTKLESIGGALIVANNSNLGNVSAFPALTKIGGALDVVGSFSSLDLPSLTSIRGGAEVDTTQSNFSCDALHKLEQKGGIQGDDFVCKAASSSTSVDLSSGSSTADSGSSSSATSGSTSATSTTTKTKKSKGAAAANNNNAAMGTFFGGLAAVAVAIL